MKIDQIDNFFANQTQFKERPNAHKERPKQTIFYLISCEVDEATQIENRIQNKCIQYRISNALLTTFSLNYRQLNTSYEKTLGFFNGKESIKKSLADDLQKFLDRLGQGL